MQEVHFDQFCSTDKHIILTQKGLTSKVLPPLWVKCVCHVGIWCPMHNPPIHYWTHVRISSQDNTLNFICEANLLPVQQQQPECVPLGQPGCRRQQSSDGTDNVKIDWSNSEYFPTPGSERWTLNFLEKLISVSCNQITIKTNAKNMLCAHLDYFIYQYVLAV